MTWPTDSLNNDDIDQGSDNPSAARSMLETLITTVKSVLANRGVADGICDLGVDAKVPIGRLPVGSGATQVAVGDHAHAEYEPADATILKSADIGDTVQPFDVATPTEAATDPEIVAGSETAIKSMSPAQIKLSAQTHSPVYTPPTAYKSVLSYAVTPAVTSKTIGSTYSGSSIALGSGTWRIMGMASNASSGPVIQYTYLALRILE